MQKLLDKTYTFTSLFRIVIKFSEIILISDMFNYLGDLMFKRSNLMFAQEINFSHILKYSLFNMISGQCSPSKM